MTLTSHTDFASFLEAVQQCRGNEELLRKGKIVCQFPQDEEKLTHILSASM